MRAGVLREDFPGEVGGVGPQGTGSRTAMASHVIHCMLAPGNGCHHTQFAQEKTEAQREEETCLKLAAAE